MASTGATTDAPPTTTAGEPLDAISHVAPPPTMDLGPAASTIRLKSQSLDSRPPTAPASTTLPSSSSTSADSAKSAGDNIDAKELAELEGTTSPSVTFTSRGARPSLSNLWMLRKSYQEMPELRKLQLQVSSGHSNLDPLETSQASVNSTASSGGGGGAGMNTGGGGAEFPITQRRPVPALSQLLENNRQWAERMHALQPEFFKTLARQQSPKILWIGCSDSRVPANQIIDLAPGEVFVHRNIANVFLHTDFNAQSVLQYAVDVLKVRHVIICGHYGCGGIAASIDSKQYGLIDNWLRNIKDLAQAHRAQLDATVEHALEQFRTGEAQKNGSLPNLAFPTAVTSPSSRDILVEANAKGKEGMVVDRATPAKEQPANIGSSQQHRHPHPHRHHHPHNHQHHTETAFDYAKKKKLELLCELNVAASLHNVCHTTIVQNAWARGQALSVHGWCYRLTDGIIRDLNLCISKLDDVEKVFHMIDHKTEASQ